MSISLDLIDSQNLSIRIHKGPSFEADLIKVQSLNRRKWNKSLGVWTTPKHNIARINRSWESRDIVADSPRIKAFLDRYRSLRTPLDTYPLSAPIDYSRWMPRDYQDRYIRYHKEKRRTLLAFEMGVGKTKAALGRAENLGFNCLLVVCPKAVLVNWRTEARSTLGIEGFIYRGTPQKREKLLSQIEKETPKIVITNFEMMAELYIGLLGAGLVVDSLIVDEAHLVSGKETKRFTHVKDIIDNLPADAPVQFLSGTPIQHRIRDIWGLLFLLAPELAGDFGDFIERYEHVVKSIHKRVPKKRYGKICLDEKGKPIYELKEIPVKVVTKNKEELRQILSAIMYRVKRSDVMDLDDRMERIYVELNPEQRKLYTKFRDELITEFEGKVFETKEETSQKILRMRQACEGLYNFKTGNLSSCKLDLAREVCRETEEKVIFWCAFKEITEILHSEFKDRAVIYNGDKSDNYKTLAKWAFNGVDSPEDEAEYHRLNKVYKLPFGPGGADIFLGTVNMQSAIGMNLHRYCKRQYFLSFPWMGNEAMQAADRLKRLGQLMVETFFVIAEDTVEGVCLTRMFDMYNETLEILDGKGDDTYIRVKDFVSLVREESRKVK